MFWNSGQTKVEGFALNIVRGEFSPGWPRLSDSAVMLFEHEYGLPLVPPALAATLAASAEHVFPVLLLCGLATRLSAFALLVMTLVIQVFVYPGAYATHGTWAALLLYLMACGPGTLSIDHWLARRRAAGVAGCAAPARWRRRAAAVRRRPGRAGRAAPAACPHPRGQGRVAPQPAGGSGPPPGGSAVRGRSRRASAGRHACGTGVQAPIGTPPPKRAAHWSHSSWFAESSERCQDTSASICISCILQQRRGETRRQEQLRHGETAAGRRAAGGFDSGHERTLQGENEAAAGRERPVGGRACRAVRGRGRGRPAHRAGDSGADRR